ncbi:MAG: hypothetical protein HF967_00200 [Methanosarcinales archaeon]|nr:hypothetical protein [Methanosarcinales archaeon]
MKILTLEQIRSDGLKYKVLKDESYWYEDDGIGYLWIKNNKIIAESILWPEFYSDGWFIYENNGNICYHLCDENGEELFIAEWINRKIDKKDKEFYIEDINAYFTKKEIIDYAKKYREEKEKFKELKVLTKTEAEEKGYEFFEFENGDYKYIDSEKIEYLIRKEKVIAVGKDIFSYPNNWYQYRIEAPDGESFDRMFNQNYHIIAESEILGLDGDGDIVDEEDMRPSSF